MSKKYYTNGVKTIRLDEGDPIPEGFYKGRTFNSNPWNKGLTKSDPRVAKNLEDNSSLFKSGHKSWNEGLSKDTNDKLKQISEKISESCLGRSAWNKGLQMSEESRKKLSASCKGRVPWNKGLTKETDLRVKQISESLIGHEDFCTDWKVAKEKEYATKFRNGTFNSSKPEDKIYQQLIDQFGEKDVIHPYRDDRYPFDCDFYIKSLDLFIEFQGTWLHGEHPFDPTNEQDVAILEEWKNLAKIKNSNFYESAVYVWSDLDVRKLSVARNNNLNFKFIYPNGLVVEN